MLNYKNSLVIALCGITLPSYGTTIFSNDETEFKVGGFLRLSAVGVEDADWQLVSNSSRINFDVTHQLSPDLEVKAFAEWQINILADRQVAALTKSQTLDIDDNRSNVLSNRLGYVKISSKSMGHFTIGKQWSGYYDIAGATDIFQTGGANASGAFDFGDGGVSGTGRADDTIRWNKKFSTKWGAINGSLQYQLHNANITVNTYNGTQGNIDNEGGFVGEVNILLTNGFSIGGAYSQTDLSSDDLVDSVGRPVDISDSWGAIVGLVYQRPNLKLALNYNDSEGRKTDNLGNVMPAEGIEATFQYYYGDNGKQGSIYGGYNYVSPTQSSLDYDQPYELSYWYLAADYNYGSFLKLFIEGQLDTGTDITFDDETDIFGSTDSKDSYVAIGVKAYW